MERGEWQGVLHSLGERGVARGLAQRGREGRPERGRERSHSLATSHLFPTVGRPATLSGERPVVLLVLTLVAREPPAASSPLLSDPGAPPWPSRRPRASRTLPGVLLTARSLRHEAWGGMRHRCMGCMGSMGHEA